MLSLCLAVSENIHRLAVFDLTSLADRSIVTYMKTKAEMISEVPADIYQKIVTLANEGLRYSEDMLEIAKISQNLSEIERWEMSVTKWRFELEQITL